MISFDEAYSIALAAAPRLGTETISYAGAMGRILAQDVVADMAMPPYDKAMVDGYACRRADLGGALTLVETIGAGTIPNHEIGGGQCAKIMTGAVVPKGADCVFMVEQSKSDGNGAVRFVGERTNDNIAPTGADIAKGDVLIRAGQRVQPPDIAVMAAMGVVNPEVYVRPKVAVVATGDELVAPEERPGAGQIRNSNGPQVCAQIERMACEAKYVGIARDTEGSLQAALDAARADCDVALWSGGVSMGEFDLVPQVFKQNGIEIQFDRVAVQPGKPTTFAKGGDFFCFGLPGNPVSSFVIFELLVRPFLYQMMGHDYRPAQVRMPLAEAFTRKSGAREAWVPVLLDEDGVRRVPYHGSAHINALCDADGLVAFPQGETDLPAGTVRSVRLIRD